MNLQEQIDEAWKERCGQWVLPYAAESHFREGYRAAMKSLFREVRPEDVQGCMDYITFENGKWWNRWWYYDKWAREQASKCDKVFVLEVPSPSEIFGEEGA